MPHGVDTDLGWIKYSAAIESASKHSYRTLE